MNEITETVRKIPNFSGPFFRWKVNYNLNREKRFVDSLIVFSSGRRHKVIEYLWYKLVWDELSKDEFFLFISCPEVLKNDKIVGFLRAKLEVPKVTLRQRLLSIELKLRLPVTSRDRYLGLRRLKIDIQRSRTRLPRTPKFSGYVRNISSLGKSSRGAVLPEPVSEFVFSDEISLDWYELLTVGDPLP